MPKRRDVNFRGQLNSADISSGNMLNLMGGSTTFSKSSSSVLVQSDVVNPMI